MLDASAVSPVYATLQIVQVQYLRCSFNIHCTDHLPAPYQRSNPKRNYQKRHSIIPFLSIVLAALSNIPYIGLMSALSLVLLQPSGHVAVGLSNRIHVAHSES